MTEPLYDAVTFWELVERRAHATPDHPMLLDEHGRHLTFAQFKTAAERTAAGLAQLGIGTNTPVTWQLPTRIETIITSIALSRLGAIQNPIIPIYREREVAFLLNETNAAYYLVPGTWRGYDYTDLATRLAATMTTPPQIIEIYHPHTLPDADPTTLPPPPPKPPTDADHPIRWIYSTSGTTADPKGVLHTDRTLIAGGVGLAKALDMSPDDVGSIAFPYTHIGGPDYLVMMLTHGFPAVLIEMFSPDRAIETLREHGATMAGGSTAFYQAFVTAQRAQPGRPVVPTLRLLSGGGAPKPPEVFYEVKRELGIPACHGMGMTEVPMVIQGSPRDTDEQLANTDGPPVFGAEVRIVDEDGTVLPTGEEGELRVRGPMVCRGYTRPELTAAAFDEDGFFRTGDLARIRDDGHVVLTGRIKDIIIRKGENVGAKEVEDLLYQHPRVADVAVIGLPDRERGERVCAVIEPVADEPLLTLPELVAYCRDAGLMTQKIPEQLEVVDHLPRNATLKILKYQLRQQLADKPWP